MHRKTHVNCLILLAAIGGGCDSRPTPTPTSVVNPVDSTQTTRDPSCAVALVNLDRISQHLGRDKRMTSEFREKQETLNVQIAGIKESYEREIESKRREIGSNPNEAQQAELATLQRELSERLMQIQQTAQADLAALPVKLVNEFRAELKPIAKQVAAERGCKVVLNLTDQVLLTFDESVDITEQVIARLHAAGYTAAREPTAQTPPRR